MSEKTKHSDNPPTVDFVVPLPIEECERRLKIAMAVHALQPFLKVYVDQPGQFVAVTGLPEGKLFALHGHFAAVPDGTRIWGWTRMHIFKGHPRGGCFQIFLIFLAVAIGTFAVAILSLNHRSWIVFGLSTLLSFGAFAVAGCVLRIDIRNNRRTRRFINGWAYHWMFEESLHYLKGDHDGMLRLMEETRWGEEDLRLLGRWPKKDMP